jgi:hypothetical protein
MEQEPQAVVSENGTIDQSLLDQASTSFVGRWNQLVSNTNWEKGRIVFQWREALIASGTPASEYADEAWARRVGGVTGQHVGRLRRVYQRFSATCEQYNGLYWSHFQAAIDWEDAEMWLEGAVQNSWSVSQMRHNRWETLGAVADHKPDDAEIVVGELDEDFEPAVNQPPAEKRKSAHSQDVASGPLDEGPDFGDDDQESGSQSSPRGADGAAIYADEKVEQAVDFVRPFANLTELPDDLADAFEAFKLAILHHKMDGWQEISREDVLASIEALKELALAPSADDAPF